jgi:transposase
MLSEQRASEWDSQIAFLEEKIMSLESTLVAYQKRCDHYAQAYDALKNQLIELLRNRFGKKSERFIDPEKRQLDFFSDYIGRFAAAEAAGETIAEEEIQLPAKPKAKKNKPTRELPRRIEIIALSEADKLCACGACKDVIRYETKELIHYQPAVFELIEQRREVGACSKGCDGQIVTAASPLHVLPKSKASEALLAFLVVSKLDDRQPLYHLEKQLFERHGVDCSRQTMARWLIDLMAPMQPLYNLLKDEIIGYDVASCDATTLQVLKEPGRRAETKSYVYCMRGGPPDKSVILYDYNDKRHKVFVDDWFTGFTGYLHVDGDNFFDKVGESAALVHCNAHARRKFEPIAHAAKGKGLAKEALRFFKGLYQIEREAKNQQLSPESRYQLRQEKSKPMMAQFKKWLDEMAPTTLPQSPLGNAMQYCLKLWPGLTRFLDDGRLEADNNLTEQEIKPLVMARKNFLFSASVDGANALCMHLGFIRTAKKHGLDPYYYYLNLLKALPLCQSVEDYEKLLPWNIQLQFGASS